MNYHNLKTINPYFNEVWDGRKKFEVRKNDRNFEVGDEVYLKEYDSENDKYSGREVRVTITYVLSKYAPIDNSYVIFSFKVTQHIIQVSKNNILR